MCVAQLDADTVATFERAEWHVPREIQIPRCVPVRDFDDLILSRRAAVVNDGIRRTDNDKSHAVKDIGAPIVVDAIANVDSFAGIYTPGTGDAECLDLTAGMPVNSGAHIDDKLTGIRAYDYILICVIAKKCLFADLKY